MPAAAPGNWEAAHMEGETLWLTCQRGCRVKGAGQVGTGMLLPGAAFPASLGSDKLELQWGTQGDPHASAISPSGCRSQWIEDIGLGGGHISCFVWAYPTT